MSAKRDYYEILGVDKSASINDIKSQYRKLALKFHPDRNKSPDAAEHFKEISEAYAILSEPDKRKIYDQYGHAGVDDRYSREDIFQGASGNFNDVFRDIFGSGGSGFDSIFESIFGGRGYSGFNDFRRQKGADLLYETSITLEEVLNGKKMEIDLSKDVECDACSGSGCLPGTQKITCTECNGQGQVRSARKMGFASFVTVSPCLKCRGRGNVIEKPCKDCKGSGKKKGSRHLSFDLPPGIDNGDYSIPGEGELVTDGINGDLIVRVRVLPHPKFKRDGADLYYDENISMVDASLGKEILVPTLDGSEKIKIEEGTQPNTIVKLKGKGLPHQNSRGRGDQYVRMVVTIPKKLNKHQKNILEELGKSFE